MVCLFCPTDEKDLSANLHPTAPKDNLGNSQRSVRLSVRVEEPAVNLALLGGFLLILYVAVLSIALARAGYRSGGALA